MKFKMPWNEQIFFCRGTSRSDKSECTAWAHTALNTNILCFTASFRSTINCQNRTHNNFLMIKSTVHSNLCRGLHNTNIFFSLPFQLDTISWNWTVETNRHLARKVSIPTELLVHLSLMHHRTPNFLNYPKRLSQKLHVSDQTL